MCPSILNVALLHFLKYLALAVLEDAASLASIGMFSFFDIFHFNFELSHKFPHNLKGAFNNTFSLTSGLSECATIKHIFCFHNTPRKSKSKISSSGKRRERKIQEIYYKARGMLFKCYFIFSHFQIGLENKAPVLGMAMSNVTVKGKSSS